MTGVSEPPQVITGYEKLPSPKSASIAWSSLKAPYVASSESVSIKYKIKNIEGVGSSLFPATHRPLSFVNIHRAMSPKIVIVGQTPPPFGGQAIMISRMLVGFEGQLDFTHVPLRFSRHMGEIGRFKVRKVMHLARVIILIVISRIKGAEIIYFPPAGKYYVPMLRDLCILCATRWLFRKTIFHFHSIGVSNFYEKGGTILRFFFRIAYFRPDVAIHISRANCAIDAVIHPKEIVVIPDGIPDATREFGDRTEKDEKNPIILFVGIISDKKGLPCLIDAASRMASRGYGFRCVVMGEFYSIEIENQIRDALCQNRLIDRFLFTGALTGAEKWNWFKRATIFCLPSREESFGIVLLEAMQFQLPIVVTRWPAAADIVEEAASGFIVDIDDSIALADRICLLLRDKELCRKMGARGREIFLERFTEEQYTRRLVELIKRISTAGETS